MKLTFTALSLVCLILTGCAASLTPEAVANADYGPPPPKNFREMIKMDFVNPFIDDEASVYTFDLPIKGYTTRSRLGNIKQRFGWVVCGTVNRKPLYAAYTGYRGPSPFFVLFQDEKIAEQFVGLRPDNSYGISYRINSIITEVCKRDAISAALQ